MKRTHATLAVSAVALFALVAVGCGGNKELKAPKDLGKTKVVEQTPNHEPDWTKHSYEEEKDFIYFSGEALAVQDKALGMRQAKADAMQNLVEAVSVKARSEYTEAIKGTNGPNGALGRYVDSLVAWTTENLDVSGAVPVEEYSEKERTRTYGGYEYAYNCYVRLRIAKDDYFKARQAALDRAAREAVDAEARQLAEGAKDALGRNND